MTIFSVDCTVVSIQDSTLISIEEQQCQTTNSSLLTVNSELEDEAEDSKLPPPQSYIDIFVPN